MADFGVTATGFRKKTLAVIKAEWEASLQLKFGKGINLRAPSFFSIIVGIASEREATNWNGEEECWNVRSRSGSQGVSLDNVGELTNEERLAEVKSKLLEQLFWGDEGTTVQSSTFRAAVDGNEAGIFGLKEDVTLIAGTDAVQKLTFSAVPDAGTFTITMPDGQVTDDIGFDAGPADVETAINLLDGWDGIGTFGSFASGFTISFHDGSTAGSAGAQVQALLVGTSSLTLSAAPVTITTVEITAGVPQGTGVMEAITAGPTTALAGTLTVINTPVSGLSATRNIDDAVVGRFVETDAEYRVRSESELQSASSATVEAIRIKLKKVEDVTEAIVYENTSLITDGNSVPGKAIHAYVAGGTDQAVLDGLWAAVGGGIETYGSVTGTVVDSQGLSQTLKFDRPTPKPVYGIYTITKNDDYPVNGDDLVMTAILAYGAALKIGEDVLIRSKLLPAIADAVPGIEDLTLTIGYAPAPVGTANLPISVSELATFASANQTVNSS